jgi:hypothetical protein
MYEEYVSFRAFFLFFFSPSTAAVGFFLPSAAADVVLAGALEPTGALPAVDAGLGAISVDKKVAGGTCGGSGRKRMENRRRVVVLYRDALVCPYLIQRVFVEN